MENTAKQVSANMPREADLAPLYADPAFRADLLFFIRLCGAYCQNIFWQAFAPSARRRRRQLFALMEKGVPQENGKNKPFGKDFKNAVLDPKQRRAQSTDILHNGFISLWTELKKDREFYAIFSAGLKQRHGLPWNIDEYLEALSALVNIRGFLEHYKERISKNEKIPSAAENACFLQIIGLLLLPQFCNELEHRAKRLQTAQAHDAAEAIKAVFAAAKEKRAESIGKMFSEARARKNIYAPGRERTKTGKYKNKKQKSRELLNGKWRKYYYGLKLSPTDFKLNSFKRAYDFIGEQNFRQICAKLGAPLKTDKLKQFDETNPQKKEFTVYASEENRLSFKNDILLFYIITMRIQKQIHFYLTEYAEKYPPISAADKNKMTNTEFKNAKQRTDKIKDESLREIRNHIAHNGLFWRIKNTAGGVFSEAEIFRRIMEILTAQNPLIADAPAPRSAHFNNAVKAILESENCAVMHFDKAENAPPATIKMSNAPTKRAKLKNLRQAGQQGKKESRKALRFQLRKWLTALEGAAKSASRK